jgi:hypothetical protein
MKKLLFAFLLWATAVTAHQVIVQPGGSGSGSIQGSGPLFTFTPPVLGDFAWMNQGTSSTSVNNDAIHLRVPSQGGRNLRGLVKAAPAVPYTITAIVAPQAVMPSDASFSGIMWRQSGSNLMLTFMTQNNSTITIVRWNSFTNPTGTLYSQSHHDGLQHLRLRDDGTTRYCEISADGTNFYTIFSEARTTGLTPDQVGFFASSDAVSGAGTGLTLYSWLTE